MFLLSAGSVERVDDGRAWRPRLLVTKQFASRTVITLIWGHVPGVRRSQRALPPGDIRAAVSSGSAIRCNIPLAIGAQAIKAGLRG